MKHIAFTCTKCGKLNIPLPGERWRGFAPCRQCGFIGELAPREGKTVAAVYREFSKRHGLPISTLFALQKRGLLPRDLANCTPAHLIAVDSVRLALASEEILRGALALLPKSRRENLIHPVASDGLLTPWQRFILDTYLRQYQHEADHNTPPPGEHRYGSCVTSLPAMILILEAKYGLSGAVTRPWITKLKKIAASRVRRRGTKKGGPKS